MVSARVLLFACAPFVPFASAGAQVFYVPDNVLQGGNCNVIPFGSSQSGPPWENQRYQTRILAAELGGLPGVISGLGFGACGSGEATHGSIEIVFDHIPAAQPFVPTFANNLTPAAVPVLAASNWLWRGAAQQFTEVGLQNYFVFNGSDDVIVQITTTGNLTLPSFETGGNQRLYDFGWQTAPSPNGTFDNAALKMEFSMLAPRRSTHGAGCVGSGGVPRMDFTGQPRFGSTLGFELYAGPPSTLAFLVLGLGPVTVPFPLDLAALGAPGCRQYFPIAATDGLFTNGSGRATRVVAIPVAPALQGLLVYTQWACVDPGRNALGLVTSDFGRFVVGA